MRTDSRELLQRKAVLAGGFVLAGAGLLVALFLLQDFPEELWLWAVLASTFVVLEWRSVDINHHLGVSPSIMAALTAAAIFGPDEGIVAVASMAALGLFTPADLAQRRWFEPMVNFGQLVVSATAAVSVLSILHPGTVTPDSVWRVAMASAAAALTYAVVNFSSVSFIVRWVYRREVLPWSRLTAALIPFLGMGFVGGLLGATYIVVGPITLPLIAAVFFVGHLTFASYGDLRESQEATLRGFVKALEAKDLYTRGHTERVAYFTQLIGSELGYDGNGLERLRWAALIHDVGKLAVPRELITKRDRLTEDEYSQMQRHVYAIEELLSEVEFLEPMVAIASHHHSHYDGAGYGHHDWHDHPGRDAHILAVADAFDAMTSTRSYRVALTQEYAFAELRRHAGSQFDPECVEALVHALASTGEVYGSIDLDNDEEARRLAALDDEANVYRIYG